MPDAEVVDMPQQETNGQQPELTLEQAFQNVAQACALFQGNLQQHTAIQQSLQLIGQTINAPAPNRQARRAK